MERIVVTAVPIQNNVTVVTDETTVNISAPITNVVQVNTPGPQGPQGIQGQSGSIDTSSFAITGSNTFIGDQIITGSMYILGSVNANSQLYEVSFLDTDDPTFPTPGAYPTGNNLILLDQDIITNENYTRNTNTITVNSSGLYKIYVQCRFQNPSGLSSEAEMAVFINDNPYRTYYIQNTKSDDTTSYNFTCAANLIINDNIGFYIYSLSQPLALRTFSKIYNSVISSYMTIEKLN